VHKLVGTWNGFKVPVVRKKVPSTNILHFEWNNLVALQGVQGVPRPIYVRKPYLYLEFVPGLSLDKLSSSQWGMLDPEAFAGELMRIWWTTHHMGYTHVDFHLHNVVVSTLTLRPWVIDWRHCEHNSGVDVSGALGFCSKVYRSIKAHSDKSPCTGFNLLSEIVIPEQEESKWWQFWR
jgi:hypothetical protein